jgi:hypothetical protein
VAASAVGRSTQGHAGDPDDRGRAGRLDARAIVIRAGRIRKIGPHRQARAKGADIDELHKEDSYEGRTASLPDEHGGAGLWNLTKRVVSAGKWSISTARFGIGCVARLEYSDGYDLSISGERADDLILLITVFSDRAGQQSVGRREAVTIAMRYAGASVVFDGATTGAAEARKQADPLAVVVWNQRDRLSGSPAQPSPTVGEALNAVQTLC